MNFTQDQLPLINLLLRIAVMAGIISLVLGFRFVVKYLMGVSVTRAAHIRMAAILAFIFILGILVRKISNQAAMDLSLEGTLFAGFIGGVWVGAGVGAAIGAFCYILGETVALPFYTAAGLASGLLFTMLGVRGEIWAYSLNPFLIIYNFLERLFKGRLDRNFIPFVVCVIFALVRYGLMGRFGYPRNLLYVNVRTGGFLMVLDLIVLIYTLGIALKMASSTRMEIIQREEEKQLTHARLSTLRSQINPHFLFNTLNSISALIRTDADKARAMTRKLSSIFRKSLENSSDTHTLGEEIEFIDNYLSIERVRFGDEKLKVVKEIAPDTLGTELPSMILQPLVENAIKHGISRMIDGGTLRIAAERKANAIEISVENDGPTAGCYVLEELLARGLGLSNVLERLKIFSRGMGELSITPRDGGGVVVRLLIPGVNERR